MADIPGEKLVIKMWDSLVDNGIGALLRPWQIRRAGRAAIDVKTEEMLAIANAEDEIKRVRAGQLDPVLRASPLRLEGPARIPQENESLLPPAEIVVYRNERADALRKEVNVAKAVLAAEEILAADLHSVPDEAPDGDWLYRWRDYASAVSSEDMQKLWGSVLAGEAIQPGRYALRTLDFLRSLSQPEAKLIEKIASFVVDDMIWRGNDLKVLSDEDVSFVDLLSVEALGVLTGVSGLLRKSWVSPAGSVQVMTAGKRGMVLRARSEVKVELDVVSVTRLGREAFSLCDVPPNPSYLAQLAAAMKALGYAVSIGNLHPQGQQPGLLQVVNERAL